MAPLPQCLECTTKSKSKPLALKIMAGDETEIPLSGDLTILLDETNHTDIPTHIDVALVSNSLTRQHNGIRAKELIGRKSGPGRGQEKKNYDSCPPRFVDAGICRSIRRARFGIYKKP